MLYTVVCVHSWMYFVSMHGSIIKVVVTCLAFFHFAVVVVGFVESLVEVDECDGRATLNVSISFPAPHPAFRLGIGIMFTLLAKTVDVILRWTSEQFQE